MVHIFLQSTLSNLCLQPAVDLCKLIFFEWIHPKAHINYNFILGYVHDEWDINKAAFGMKKQGGGWYSKQ